MVYFARSQFRNMLIQDILAREYPSGEVGRKKRTGQKLTRFSDANVQLFSWKRGVRSQKLTSQTSAHVARPIERRTHRAERSLQRWPQAPPSARQHIER